MSAAREAMLARVRAALADVGASEPERWEGPGPAGAPDAYRRGSELDREGVVALFCERVADHHAEVVRCADAGAVPGAIAAALARHGAHTVLAGAGLPEAWRGSGVDWRLDGGEAPLAVAELDAVDGVVGTAALGIAETGTIALDHGPGQGRRALTLVPDLYVCVVRADQVVATVPEAIERLHAAAAAGRPVTLISGPSATSDIELVRVEGVHGPRRLVAIVAG